MAEYLTQVKMTTGNTQRVGWVEQEFATVGKRVRDEDDDTGPIWTVAEVYGRVLKDAIDWQDKAQRDFAKKLNVKNDRS